MTNRVDQQLGNYRLLRLIGEGGFAQVYLGEHIHLGTQAAIKILDTQLSQHDYEQFRTEARIIARLEHPFIIRVLDFDIVEKTPYFVMSYAPNGTFRQSYPKGTRLPLTSVVEHVTQIAQALQYAHDQKIIHRDIKPENILLGRSREALLSDFGIALVTRTSRSFVETGLAGTVTYMAPEQIRGKPVPASDQYALAVIVYEWITGERPFQGSFAEIVAQHTGAQPPSLRVKVPDLSPAVEEVVLRALYKDPQQRFPHMLAFATALEQAVTNSNEEIIPTWLSTGNNVLSAEQPSDPFDTTVIRSRPSQEPSPVESANLVTPSRQANTPSHHLAKTPTPFAHASEIFPINTATGRSRISRRRAVFLVSIVTASAALGGGLAWLLSSQHGAQTFTKQVTQISVTSVPISRRTSTTTSTPTVPATSTPTPVSAHPIGTTLNVYRGHSLYIYGVTWASSDGQRIASASDDQTVQDWDAYNNQRYFAYGQNGPVNDVKASHNKAWIASAGEDNTVQIRDAQDGTLIAVYTGHSGAVNTVEWSPNDQYIVSASSDNTVRVWEAASRNTLTIYRLHSGIVWAAGWSPNGKSIISGSADNTARIWDATSGATLQVYTKHTGTVRSVSWSEQNYGIATASEDLTVQVWNPQTGTTLTTYGGHTALLRTVSWAHTSSHIVSGARDATAQIWDGLSGQHIYTYSGHSSTVFDAQWSPDDKLIVSGSTDTTAQVWQAS
jgi:eukaryotic-like serine/threonine-protein kinase